MFAWRHRGHEDGFLVRNVVLTNAGDYFVVRDTGEGYDEVVVSGPMSDLAFENDGKAIAAPSTPIRGDIRLEPDEDVNGNVVRDLFMAPVMDGGTVHVRRFEKRIRRAVDDDPISTAPIVFASRSMTVETETGIQEGDAIMRDRSDGTAIATIDLVFQYDGYNLTAGTKAKAWLQAAALQGAYSHIASNESAVYAFRTSGGLGVAGVDDGNGNLSAVPVTGGSWEGNIASVTVLGSVDDVTFIRVATYRERTERIWSRIPSGNDAGNEFDATVREAFVYFARVSGSQIIEMYEDGHVVGEAVDSNGDGYLDKIEYTEQGAVRTAMKASGEPFFMVPGDAGPFVIYSLSMGTGLTLEGRSDGSWILAGQPYAMQGSRVAYTGQSGVRRDLRVDPKTQAEMGL